MRQFILVFLILPFICQPSTLIGQKSNYYFSLHELLSLSRDNDAHVKNTVVPKGYDFWENLSSDSIDFYSEARSNLRTGSNLAKAKISIGDTYKFILSYSVALQYDDQVSWLRTFNKELKDSAYNKIANSDYSSVYFNQDTSLQILVEVKTYEKNSQIASVSIWEFLKHGSVLTKKKEATVSKVLQKDLTISQLEKITLNSYDSSVTELIKYGFAEKSGYYVRKSLDDQVQLLRFISLKGDSKSIL